MCYYIDSEVVPSYFPINKQIYPCNRLWRPIGWWDVENPTSSIDNRLTDGGKVASFIRRPPFTPRKVPGTHFCLRLSRLQGHSALERFRLIKKSNDRIGDRTRDLPGCSIVPQPTTLPYSYIPVLDEFRLVRAITKQNPYIFSEVTLRSHPLLVVILRPAFVSCHSPS
jgi:hypothetical protein